jgi:hypothetical protein
MRRCYISQSRSAASPPISTPSRGLVAFFGSMYFAALRPGRRRHCESRPPVARGGLGRAAAGGVDSRSGRSVDRQRAPARGVSAEAPRARRETGRTMPTRADGAPARATLPHLAPGPMRCCSAASAAACRGPRSRSGAVTPLPCSSRSRRSASSARKTRPDAGSRRPSGAGMRRTSARIQRGQALSAGASRGRPDWTRSRLASVCPGHRRLGGCGAVPPVGWNPHWNPFNGKLGDSSTPPMSCADPLPRPRDRDFGRFSALGPGTRSGCHWARREEITAPVPLGRGPFGPSQGPWPRLACVAQGPAAVRWPAARSEPAPGVQPGPSGWARS